MFDRVSTRRQGVIETSTPRGVDDPGTDISGLGVTPAVICFAAATSCGVVACQDNGACQFFKGTESWDCAQAPLADTLATHTNLHQ